MDEHDIVSEKDLEHLLHILDSNVGDAAWQNQMERTTPNMFYQSWRHEPEVILNFLKFLLYMSP